MEQQCYVNTDTVSGLSYFDDPKYFEATEWISTTRFLIPPFEFGSDQFILNVGHN